MPVDRAQIVVQLTLQYRGIGVRRIGCARPDACPHGCGCDIEPDSAEGNTAAAGDPLEGVALCGSGRDCVDDDGLSRLQGLGRSRLDLGIDSLADVGDAGV